MTIVWDMTAYAEMPVPPPPSNGYVLDQTNTLSPEQVTELNEKIASYRKRTSVQLAVLMVPSISEDDYLERFSLNVARGWGIGQKDKNNGALLLVAKNDRKLRIEVGTGLEGDLTDARAGRIIRDRITPEFKQNRYYEGIVKGLDGMTLAIAAKTDPSINEQSPSNGWLGNIGNMAEAVFFIGFFTFTWLSSILARTKSWWAGGLIGGALGGLGGLFLSGGTLIVALLSGIVFVLLGLLFDYLVSKNYHSAVDGGYAPSWWAGGTTLGGGGGSSGGFGGGGFGGGGASGDW